MHSIENNSKESLKITSQKCEVPLSLQILKSRWRLFGHILLRRDPKISANEAMQFYSVENNKRPRGRPITTLQVTLNNDLKHVRARKRLKHHQKTWISFETLQRTETNGGPSSRRQQKEQPKLCGQTTLQLKQAATSQVKSHPKNG
ncbi:hypothetical protein ElyMa_006096600 [Elysia marginata]|uniref:Uncharacterized protein n=1 Tax=Elysia marginata TaxID=1093978 RepID=A0AAV4GSN0_9GAST|nr:hypothetical protein ElyMa_006096600 [Elysia marginata]